jgi:hypothetical protein
MTEKELRRQLLDSTDLGQYEYAEEAKQILGSNMEYGNVDCLYIFFKIFEQNLCVHKDLIRDKIIYCHFTSIRNYKKFIHLHLKNTHFMTYIKIISKPQELINNEINSYMICKNDYEDIFDKKNSK